MSLTNPNTLVTEERLSEFYQQILPYLGGFPSVVASKFNRSDIYSTEEKLIGQWIDGKPLYMKSTSKSYNASQMSSGAPVNLINLGSDCHVLFASGMAHSTTNGSLPINYFDSSVRVNLAFNMNDTGSAIQEGNVWVSSNWNKALTFYVNLYYTKTTDSPISMGTQNDYSTTEKIIGTWIDGKPLYQKTLIFLPQYSSSDTDTLIDLGIQIDNGWVIGGFIKFTSGTTITFPSVNGAGTPVIRADIYDNSHISLANKLKIYNTQSWSNNTTSVINWYITIQYTKA